MGGAPGKRTISSALENRWISDNDARVRWIGFTRRPRASAADCSLSLSQLRKRVRWGGNWECLDHNSGVDDDEWIERDTRVADRSGLNWFADVYANAQERTEIERQRQGDYALEREE
jgi:hypothetical protein